MPVSAGSASADVVVVGATVAGLAAAARLARNRHRVVVIDAGSRPGGRSAPYPCPDDPAVAVDDWPLMFSFPAPWRDLFRKSGRPFDDELARSGQQLVPAPATRHVFDDGTELVLPTDRGVQFAVLGRTYGDAVARRWRDLLDRFDEVWQALRSLGQESEWRDAGQLRARRHVLQPSRSVADLARGIGEPHLAALITDTAHRIGSDPARTPGWLAVHLSVERRFGRWMMTTDDRVDRGSTLLDRLVARLATRRVELITDTRVTAIAHDGRRVTGVDTDDRHWTTGQVVLTQQPWQTYDLLTAVPATDRDTRRGLAAEDRAVRRSRPARSPEIRHTLAQPARDDAAAATSEATETIRHTSRGPVITWTRPLADGRVLDSVHDWTAARPDPAAGIAWRGVRTALRRPPIRSALDGAYLAGPHSRGGNQLTACVLSGALASYACHDALAD